MTDDAIITEEQHQCDVHGQFTATVTTYPNFGGWGREMAFPTRCPGCVQDRKDEERAREQQKHRDKIADIKADAGVPARYARASFDGYRCESKPQTSAHAIIQAYAETWDEQAARGQSLLLVGGPGTGKTHLATATINALADRLQRSLYGTAAELVGDIKRHYGRRGGEESVSGAIAELVNVPLLVIDELDVGVTEHDLTLLFRVIDGRYSELQPMILISNRTAEQLGDTLGQRLMDRLRECAVTVPFTWASYRGQRR